MIRHFPDFDLALGPTRSQLLALRLWKVEQIAAHYNVTRAMVRKWFDDYGIIKPAAATPERRREMPAAIKETPGRR